MRIGIDYTSAVRQAAGIGRLTRGVVHALARLDHDNEYVLLLVGCQPEEAGGNWPPNFTVRTIPIAERLMTILWHRLRVPFLWVEWWTGPLDVFHAPDFVLPPVRRARTLVTVHDLSFMRRPECTPSALRSYLNKVVPRSVRRADRVLADSQSTRRDLMELLGAPGDKIQVIYGGVEERFQPVRDQETLAQVRARYRLPEHFILGLGTLEPRKNFERLIIAYARLMGRWPGAERSVDLPHKLVIAGRRGWLYEEIFTQVRQLGLHNDIIFAGFIADEDLPALYTLADCFAYPSLYEGFGLPPLEAMACGTPVVVSNVASLPEVVGDAGLLVDPEDVEDIARALGRVLTDEGLRRRMIERGLARAREFTWERAARLLLAEYKRVAS